MKTMSVAQFRMRYKHRLRCLHSQWFGWPDLRVWKGYLFACYWMGQYLVRVEILRRIGRGLTTVENVDDISEAREHVNQLLQKRGA